MPRFDLVVFDLAGTTMDDGGAVVEAFARALEPLGVRVGVRELQPFRGANKMDVLRHFLGRRPGAAGEPLVAEASARFQGELVCAYADGALRELANAGQVFDQLRKGGVRVALNSGLPRSIVDLIIATLGWSGRVDASVAGDEVSRGRPAPDLLLAAMARAGVSDEHRVIAVGDTRFDLQAGTRAGCGAVVGVLSGAGSLQQLAAGPHTHLCASIAGVPAIAL